MASNDGLKFYYGDYTHPAGEVYPAGVSIVHKKSEVNTRWATEIRLRIAGHFTDVEPELTPEQVDARIVGLRTAYQDDYKDCGFLLNDDTPTDHYILTEGVNNLSGNYIVSRSWDNQLPTEFANTRSFSVTIGALLLDAYTNILMFSESVEKRGTGGPKWRITNRWDGEPIKETIYSKTMVTHVQRGIIVGLNDYLQPPLPLWPDEEQEWLRLKEDVTPRYHGEPTYDKPTHFVTRYAYYFKRLGPDPLTRPNPWG